TAFIIAKQRACFNRKRKDCTGNLHCQAHMCLYGKHFSENYTNQQNAQLFLRNQLLFHISKVKKFCRMG
ncbi:MAG: hypothetical protein SOV73_08350, partial [Candidatus Faecivivens sp.]|nr:hypothetical protein [Candidatus Faecivivens sp.]